jgi:uncharacterized protein (TIGR01244 family)
MLKSTRCGCLPLILACLFVGNAGAASDEFSAPNIVRINPKLITSGQPTAAALKSLKQQGIETVIYLVPSNTNGEVPEEAALLRQQGINYIHIPIPFGAPTEKHYMAFAEAMSKSANQHVLVHCEINLRGSSMTFLYRAIALKEDPQLAFESVAKVWSPRGAWKPFIDELLKKNGIAFAVY